jgi:subtilisin family serine protease
MQTNQLRHQPFEFTTLIQARRSPPRALLLLVLPLIMISLNSVEAQMQFPLVPPIEGSQPTLSAKPLQTMQGEYIIRVANNKGLQAITEGERQTAKDEVTTNSYLVYSAIALEQDIKALVKSGFVASAAKLKRRKRRRPAKRNTVLSLVSDSFCDEVLKRKNVVSCSPNFVIRAQLTSNDTLYPFQWGLTSGFGANAADAWSSGTTSGNVVVAVTDTGVDYNHPDLRANMWRNPFDPPNGKDDDKNGYIDDVYGINTVGDTADPGDDQGHGTHVAGIIGAKGNNKAGVAGIAWTTKILAVKFLDKDGAGTLGSVLKAFAYIEDMVDNGINIRVINASWGGPETAEELYNAIARLTNRGIILAAAAGNESSNNDTKPSYPSSYDLPNIISIGSISAFKNLSSFSNYGQSVDITAPGDFILSTWPKGQYMPLSGTSMATPHVTGALALLYGRKPSMTATQAINKLYSSATRVPTLKGKIAENRALNVAALVR